MQLKVGDKAPAFSATNQDGKMKSLSEFKGKWLVLYFYPKDFTSGCTKEACEFRDHYQELKTKAAIVGVSSDSQASHAKFTQKHDLPFTLLSDINKKIIKDYGAKAGILTRRFTYLIDPKGKIAKIYKSVKPKIHALQVIRDLEALQSS